MDHAAPDLDPLTVLEAAGLLGPDPRLLAFAYPEFTIGQFGSGWHGPTWAVIRKDASQPGLYAAVSPDLGELREVLAVHASQEPADSRAGT